MQWLSNNPETIIGLAILIFGLVATWTMFGADIRQLKKDTADIKGELHELVRIEQAHRMDTSLHIDPHRDEKRMDDLKHDIFNRFDAVDRKLEKLMIIHPPGPLA